MATFPPTMVTAVMALVGLFSCISPAAAAEQDPASTDLPVSLGRIRAAVHKPDVRIARLDLTAQVPVARFTTGVEQRRFMLTFEEQLKKDLELTHLLRQSHDWGSRCCGIDLGALLKPVGRALQERKPRKIREQIAGDLEALKAADR